MAAQGEDRRRTPPYVERRPHPQVLETMLDELEDKVRHYFLLYIKERRRRQKCEKFCYWMQQEMTTNQRLLLESQQYSESLEAKIEEIRGDPDSVRDTVQRVDLMYAQIDTLIQAFAGVCSFVATREADRQVILQCVLDYLYPCRALDPRLNALYGALYYYRLGEYKGLPEQPPPPPEPRFMPLHEIMGPWIQPTPFAPHPTLQGHETKFDAALAATVEAAKASEGTPAKADAQTIVRKKVELQKPAEAVPVKKANGATPAAGEQRAKGSLPQQAADASADVELTGMSILLEELTGFKRPPMSKGAGVRLVVRFDHESSIEVRKKPERCVTIDKCEGSPGNESASVYFLAQLSPLPPKKTGVLPKICIDLYDEKSPSGLGSAQKTFTDADTAKKSASWQIKDTKGSPIGSLSVSIAPVPLNALLPAQAKKVTGKTIGGAAPKKAEAGKPESPKEAAKSASAGAKEKSEAASGVSKPEVSKSASIGTKPDLPKPGAAVSKPDLPKPAETAGKKPELPKPAAGATKPELPKPGGAGVTKPELPKPGGAGVTKPELPKPGGAGVTKPELPKPGDASVAKQGAPEPGPAGFKKPELPKAPGSAAKPDLPKPGLPEAAKPALGKPELPAVKEKETLKKPDLPKPGGPPGPGDVKPVAPLAGPGAKPGEPETKKGPVAPAAAGPAAAVPPAAAKPAVAPKGEVGAAPGLLKPGTKPSLPAKPGEIAKPGLVKPAAAFKPAIVPKPGLAKPALGKAPLAKPAIPAKPMLPLAKKGLEAKPVLSKPGLPPTKAA